METFFGVVESYSEMQWRERTNNDTYRFNKPKMRRKNQRELLKTMWRRFPRIIKIQAQRFAVQTFLL
jgi:hypothetical protein